MSDQDRQPGRRIRVVGTSGAGKTTLAQHLAERLGIPHVELDALHWEANWQMAESKVFDGRLEEATTSDAWVVDGNYSDKTERALPWRRVDTLVFLDYSLAAILWRIVTRTVRRVILGTELWSGNRETWRDVFSRDSIILWSLTTFRRRRHQYRAMLTNPEVAHLTIIHLRSPREAAMWLRKVQPRPAGPASLRSGHR